MNQGIAIKPKESRTLSARIAARFVRSRRRVGTVAAFAIAGLLAYHGVVGNNGLNVYKQKLAEDKQLAVAVKQLQQENDRLKKHVDHLASDPDAIEYEAHERLHYTRPGQVIVLNNNTLASDVPPASPTK